MQKLVELVRLDAGGLRHAGLLLDPHDLQAVGLLQLAVVERDRAGEDAEQRGLARAVSSDQADALAGLHRERGAVEERQVAVVQLGVGEGEERHAARTIFPPTYNGAT